MYDDQNPTIVTEHTNKCDDQNQTTVTNNPQEVLSIPQETLDAHKLAGVLGSPLEVGKNMYKDLQDKPCSKYNVYD